MPLQDIRNLKDDPEAYQKELERRWTGLLSYRYIGRNHGSMNSGPEDNTVTLRRDMRNATGGLMVAPLSMARSPSAKIVPHATGTSWILIWYCRCSSLILSRMRTFFDTDSSACWNMGFLHG